MSTAIVVGIVYFVSLPAAAYLFGRSGGESKNAGIVWAGPLAVTICLCILAMEAGKACRARRT